MHHQPTETELAALPSLPTNERLYYFLTRAIECEEVWGLTDQVGWVMREAEGNTILPVWSYESLAKAYNDDADLHPESTSLERFIEILRHPPEPIYLDILAMPGCPGVLIPADEVLGMFESLIDSGTYFLEG